ncbi:hypothetical protein [Alicyclobacillus acidocaldarius]|nr:hypothetical protein [Alicyclobacillus acidocaldarius]
MGHLSALARAVAAYDEPSRLKGVAFMGTFGGYTRWAVVFLIIFVLFFLLVPAVGMAAPSCGCTPGAGAGVYGAY